MTFSFAGAQADKVDMGAENLEKISTKNTPCEAISILCLT